MTQAQHAPANDVKRNKRTGRGYKITSVSKAYAERHGHGQHFLALFEAGALVSHDGWWCAVKRHALGDGRAFIAKARGEA